MSGQLVVTELKCDFCVLLSGEWRVIKTCT